MANQGDIPYISFARLGNDRSATTFNEETRNHFVPEPWWPLHIIPRDLIRRRPLCVQVRVEKLGVKRCREFV